MHSVDLIDVIFFSIGFPSSGEQDRAFVLAIKKKQQQKKLHI